MGWPGLYRDATRALTRVAGNAACITILPAADLFLETKPERAAIQTVPEKRMPLMFRIRPCDYQGSLKI